MNCNIFYPTPTGNAVDGARKKAELSKARAAEIAAHRESLIGTTLAPDYSYDDGLQRRDAESSDYMTSYDYYLLEQEQAQAQAEVDELNNLVGLLYLLSYIKQISHYVFLNRPHK